MLQRKAHQRSNCCSAFEPQKIGDDRERQTHIGSLNHVAVKFAAAAPKDMLRLSDTAGEALRRRGDDLLYEPIQPNTFCVRFITSAEPAIVVVLNRIRVLAELEQLVIRFARWVWSIRRSHGLTRRGDYGRKVSESIRH